MATDPAVFKLPNSGQTSPQISLNVVAGGTQSACRSATRNSPSRYVPVHRCIHHRVGSASGQLSSCRPVEPTGQKPTYQLARTSSSFPSSAEIRAHCDFPPCISQYRQYNGGSLYKQVGGDEIPNPMLSVMGSNDLVPGEGREAESSSPPRQTKSHCGCSIAQQTSASYRMVSPTRGGQPSFPPVADTHNGLVRDIQKPQTPSVCVPSTGPQSGSSGCSVHVMEGINSVRFPSPSSPSPGITQNSGRGDDNDPSCPPVAQQVMVSNTVGTTDTESPRTTVTRGSTISGGRPGSSGPRRLPPSRIQVVEQALLKKGFSKSTAAIIARPQRTSTLAAYEDKWQKFVDWCDKRQITPINASCSQLAEFFLFLFKEKEFSPKTKAVYRSAIAATIKSLGGGGFRSQQYLISYDKELYD